MAKRSAKKKRQPDYQQVARKILDTIAPDAEPKAIKPAKTPRRPKGKQELLVPDMYYEQDDE